MNKNVTTQGKFPYQLFKPLSLPLWVAFQSVCAAPKQEDVVLELFDQDTEHRLSEANVAASCKCLPNRGAWFVSPWSQARAHWFWERMEVLSIAEAHKHSGKRFKNIPNNKNTSCREKKTENQTPLCCALNKNVKCTCGHTQAWHQN